MGRLLLCLVCRGDYAYSFTMSQGLETPVALELFCEMLETLSERPISGIVLLRWSRSDILSLMLSIMSLILISCSVASYRYSSRYFMSYKLVCLTGQIFLATPGYRLLGICSLSSCQVAFCS